MATDKREVPAIRQDVRRLARELMTLEKSVGNIKDVIKLLRRMDLTPMDYVLELVPGETVTEKSNLIGVTRQTYYHWLNGRSRPSIQQAKRLSKLTGIPEEELRISEPA
jgi:transcriptional regulator with XRE-family HTH domain